MRDRRTARRDRVCLEGALASGLTGPIAEVRIRNLSGRGAEIVVPGGQIASLDVELAIPRRARVAKARVVWRRMDRFGLSFDADASTNAATSPTLDRFLSERAGRAA